MEQAVRVIVLGSGNMGSGIARLLLRKCGVELVGLYARRASRSGLDVGEVVGLGHPLGIAVSHDLGALVRSTHPDIALQATCSTLVEARGEIETLLRHGVSVISTAEEMAFPWAVSPVLADEFDALARTHGARLLGTGVNPGFMLDLLPIALSGLCAEVESITVIRTNDLSPYGPTVMREQGVGLTPEAFQTGVADGSVVGHVGFRQSIAMIAATLGWEVERIEERREPILSSVARETPAVRVLPGEVAGCRHTAVAYGGGRPLITLIHPQQVHPELEGVVTGDTVEIHGTPTIRLSGAPEVPGGEATCALVVNMIPRLLAATPGLHTMATLPVPGALLGDVRRMMGREEET